MSTTAYVSMVWRLVVLLAIASLVVPVGQLSAQESLTQPPLQFCPISGFPDAKVIVSNVDNDANTVSGTILAVNPSTYHLPGAHIGVAVYENEEVELPMFWTTLPDEVRLTPSDRSTIPFSFDMSRLPAGEYSIRAFIAQGENEVLATALRNYTIVAADNFTKTGQATDSALSVTVEDAAQDGSEFTLDDPSIPFDITVAGSAAAEDTKLLVSRHSQPFGDSVYVDQVVAGDFTQTTTLPSGPYSVYAYPVVANTLTPLTTATILLGETEDQWLNVYPYISIIGLSGHPIEDGTEATVCLGNYSPDNYRVAVPTEAVQVDFQVLNPAGQVVDSEQPQTPRLQNFATFSLNSIAADSEFKAILSTERTYDLATNGPDFTAVQTIDFAHDCGEACELPLPVVITEFTQEETFLTSFWFYLGIVLSAALLMLVMLQRLGHRNHEQTVLSSYQSPDELQ